MLPLRDPRPIGRTPWVVVAIVAACVAVFGVELWVGAAGGDAATGAFYRRFGLIPLRLTSAIAAGRLDAAAALPLVTHLFVHAGWLHLAGNLLYLWVFGRAVEDRSGRSVTALLFLFGGLLAATAQVLFDPTSDVPIIGASGAISALLGVYLVLFPGARVLSLVFLGCFYQLMLIPAFVLLGLWFALQLVEALVSLGPAGPAAGGVALFAHLGGFVAGLAAGIVIRRFRPARPGSVG